MRARLTILVALGGVLAGLPFVWALAEGPVNRKVPLVDLEAIRTTALQSKMQTVDQLDVVLGGEADRRRELFTSLDSLLSDRDMRVRASACYLVGLYRFDDGIEPLSRLIGETLPVRFHVESPVLSTTPAKSALIQIGTRKVSLVMLKLIRESKVELERDRAVEVLVAVEGKRFADLMLADALANAPAGSPEAARLGAARQRVQPARE